MNCKVCGKPGAVICSSKFANILIAHGAYCSSECFAEDSKKGAECYKTNRIRHALAECQCQAVIPTVDLI